MHSSLLFLTDAVTFITLYNLKTITYSTLGEIIGRHLHLHFITWKNFDVIHTHLTGDVTNNLMSILQLYAKHRIG